MDKVAPGIWLGDRRAAAKIVAAAKAKQKQGRGSKEEDGTATISHIINLSDKVFYMPRAPGLSFNHIPLNDFGKFTRTLTSGTSGSAGGGGILLVVATTAPSPKNKTHTHARARTHNRTLSLLLQVNQS